MNRFLWIIGFVSCGFMTIAAGEPPERESDEVAIRKAVAAYVDAFNNADAKSLASMWTSEAVYKDLKNGDEVIGREAIEKQFTTYFAESKGSKLEVETHSIEFISPNVALENGSAKVITDDGTLESTNYAAVYIKTESGWLLDRITEEEVIPVLSNYEHLKELEWLTGHWIDQDDTAMVITDCRWSRNESFLLRYFTCHINDDIDLSGVQIIGWDPTAQKIRSWVFDSDGGFGEGTWTKKDSAWSVQQTAILPDGRKSSSLNIITYIDDNTMTLQTVNRTLDGELLPNIEEVKVTKE